MNRYIMLVVLTLAALPAFAQQTQPAQPAQPTMPTITVTAAVAPEYTGRVFSMGQGTTGTTLHINGALWRVANGTTIADLALSVNATGPANSQGVLYAQNIEPTPSGIVMTEWHNPNFAPLPLQFNPTSGTLANDTAYLIRYQLYVSGYTETYFGILIIVGNPASQDVGISPTIGGSAITGPVNVPAGTTLESLGLNITAENYLYESIGAYVTVTNHAAAGIDLAEFKGCEHHSIQLPNTATPAGVFNQVGTHTFTVQAFGLKWSTNPIYLECKALRIEFVVNVLPAPEITVQDAQGVIQPGGARDLGTYDAASLPGAWHVYTVSNAGIGDLTLAAPVWTSPFVGDGSAAFELDLSTFQTVVAPGYSTQFSVRVAASASGGDHEARLSIANDDPYLAGDFTIDVSAHVTTTPVLSVSDGAGALTTGDSRDFGAVDMTTMPATLNFQVANSGTGSLTITSVSLAGGGSAHFALDLGMMAYSLAAGASAGFDVHFDAQLIGAHVAQVVIQHPGGSFEINLQGAAYTSNTPVITVAALPGALQGTSYSPFSLPVAGGEAPYTFQSVGGALPAGMTLGSNGEVTGTPSEAGTFQFTARVTDLVGASSEQSLTIVVAFSAAAQSPGGGGGGGCASAPSASGLWVLALLAGLLWLTRRIPTPTRSA